MPCPWLLVFAVRHSVGIGVVATIFLVGFAIIVVVALWQNAKEARQKRRLMEHGARAVGHVVFHSRKTKPGKGRLHFAKIKLKTPDGREFRHAMEHGTRDPSPPLGAKVQIAHDPARPDKSILVD